MNDLMYVWEKYYKAVWTLVAHHGPVVERVMAAYDDTRHADPGASVPAEIRTQIAELTDLLTRHNREDVQLSMASMSDDEAGEAARQIFEIMLSLEAAKPV